MGPSHEMLPATRDDAPRDLEGTIERTISEVPAPRTRAVADPDRAAEEIAKRSARQAAVLSGSLALPPGPFGLLTVLPDLYLIWKTQRQMVADIFALYGRTAELTRSHMLYCLFRHAASQVLRDFAVRTGQRVVVQQLSGGALKTVVAKVGMSVSKRAAGSAAGRWVPVAGAAAVGAYAYWDTLQVAKTARRLLADPALDATEPRQRA
ncbi:MAG: hypothetical protein IPM22_01140 [Betaproteobacteria bacterium]|nr:hypothetical protein [Betaproteobacteria bacterium]